MNKHILFVMRSLDNPELFTQQEKEANKIAAYAAADAAYAAAAVDAVDAYAAAYAAAADVEYWVNLFFKRSGEDKQVYINEVERLKEDEVERLKAGDKVKFSASTKMLQGLDPYGIYTVAKTERSFVYLDILDTEQGCWYESDFEKVEDNKHKHHALMIKHANDCTLKVQVKYLDKWVAIRYPRWESSKEYRIKPKPERKPFNLEEALAGKRVVTTEGDEVTQLVQFKTLSYPDNIYGVVKGAVMCWNDDGSYPNSSGRYQLYMQELKQ